MADVNHDGKQDLIVSDALTNTVSVLLGNGDDSFQAPREYAIGAMDASVGSVDNLAELRTFKRGLAVADLTGDGNVDIVVTNPASADVSVLLGNGDGTFQPQRRFDAGPLPDSVVTADFNGDGIPDLAVLSTSFGDSTLAILLGRGNGSFLPARLGATPVTNSSGLIGIYAADVTGDGTVDLVITGGTNQETYIYAGNGDGTFQLSGNFVGSGPGIAVADLNGDGIPDIVNANFSNSTISYVLGNPDGTFSPAPQGSLTAGVTPLAVAVADVGSQITLPDGSTILGAPDGHPDLIIADSGIPQTVFTGPPEIVVLPGIFDSHGFEGFGSPIRIASGMRPESLATGNVNGGGKIDVAYVDTDGVHIILPGSSTPLALNDTPQTARDLGVGVHVLEPTLTIVPGHEDAYYAITVPTEAVPGSGDEVMDFNGGFLATHGAGLDMQVTDLAGNVLASGEHIRLRLPQGQRLILHVLGVAASDGSRGAGAYTLDVDVLPQVVSVAAEPLLAGKNGGGPASTLVITLQGDRLDPTTAQDPSNYTVTWLGPDGIAGTTDDRVLTPSSIVYDPSANVDVASGLTYPTAVRQTATLAFAAPLRPGSYLVQLSPRIGTATFNEDETILLPGTNSATAHPVVQVAGNAINQGASLLLPHLVRASEAGSFSSFSAGTPFLTQLHDDLGALLDAALSKGGDQPAITSALLNVVVGRFAPGLRAANLGGRSVLVIWLDPPELDIADSAANHIRYNASDQSVINGISNAFVSVAGNVELVVLPGGIGGASSQFALTLANVRDTSRGGAVLFTPQGDFLFSLTDSLRAGQNVYSFGSDAAPSPATPSVALLDRAAPSHVFVALITTVATEMMPEPAKAASPQVTATIAPAEPAPPLMPGAWLAATRRHRPGWIEIFGNFLRNAIDAVRGFFTAIQQSAGRPARPPPRAPAASGSSPAPSPHVSLPPPATGAPEVAPFWEDGKPHIRLDAPPKPQAFAEAQGIDASCQSLALLGLHGRITGRCAVASGSQAKQRRRPRRAARM